MCNKERQSHWHWLVGVHVRVAAPPAHTLQVWADFKSLHMGVSGWCSCAELPGWTGDCVCTGMSPSSVVCRCWDDLRPPLSAPRCQDLYPGKVEVRRSGMRQQIHTMHTSVPYLLTVMGPPVSWAWGRCLSAASLQNLAPWIPFL